MSRQWQKEGALKPEQNPITGNEDKALLSAPKAALSRFYEAFNKRDMELMANHWAQNDEISMDNPLGGIKRGWPEIRGVYERIFSGPAKVSVEYFDYTIHEASDMFYAVGRERGSFSRNGNTIDLAIRTSRIFKRIEGSWKQVHHHGSIEDPDLLKRYQSAVTTGSTYATGGLDHIGLNVKNLEQSIDFYEGFFGFPVIAKWETPRQAFVGKDDVVLGLLESPGYDFTAQTMAHIAFSCDKQEFPRIVDRIRQQGLEIVSGPKEQRGGETVLFRDPSGNILEICHPALTLWKQSKAGLEAETVDLAYIRRNIDQLDSMIITLLAKRSDLVAAAATVKKSEQGVRDPKRVEQVFERVRSKAAEAGLDPEIAEKTYRTMIDCFVSKEMSLFKRSE